jgi:hypothetical protein
LLHLISNIRERWKEKEEMKYTKKAESFRKKREKKIKEMVAMRML